MASKKTKTAKDASPKDALKTSIEKAKGVLAKHTEKPGNDPKRRLAHKRLKRAQRNLLRIVTAEKKAEAKAKKAETTA